MKRVAIFQIVLAAIVLMVLHPRNNGEWFACLVILVAGEVVVYRDLLTLNGSAVGDGGQRVAGSAQTGTRQTRSSQADPQSGSDSPRYDGIELRSGDSVEQIARAMVITSFRQASMKYHPDHGGSNELMGRIVQARAMLLSALRHQ